MQSQPEDRPPDKSSPKPIAFITRLATIFSLSFYLTLGGIFLWQNHGVQSEAEAAGGIIPDENTRHQMAATATSVLPTRTVPRPTATRTKTATPLPTVTPLAQVEPNSTSNQCSKTPLTVSPPLTTPVVSAISLATRQNQADWPLDNRVQFTTPITKIEASFGYLGMQDGLSWERVWYFNNQEISRGQGIWDAGTKGELTVYAQTSTEGFKTGPYQLEVIVDGQPVSRQDFLIVEPEQQKIQPIQVAYTVPLSQGYRLNLLQLADNQTEVLFDAARSPSWSANGRGLLFYAEPGFQAESSGLHVVSMTSKQPTQLDSTLPFRSVAWSPIDNYIAGSLNTADQPNIVLWPINGEAAPQIGPPGETPDWSPQGRRLVYRSCDPDGWHISTIRVVRNYFDPTSIKQLTEGDDRQPVWSADGQWIAFARLQKNNNLEIYTMRFDGSDLRRVTNASGPDLAPAWTPDNRIIFRSQREGSWGLYIMEADGSDLRRLVDAPAPDDWLQIERAAVSTNIEAIEPLAVKPQIAIPVGQGLLVVSNRKNPDELTFTINTKEIVIAPYQVRNIPLPAGHHLWTASWPSKSGLSGTADIVVGQIAYPIVDR